MRSKSTTLKKIGGEQMERWGRAAALLGMSRAQFMIQACDLRAEHLLGPDKPEVKA